MLESQSWKNKISTKMRRLKRWWYLSKLLTITITSFNFFSCPVKLKRNLKLKFRSKVDHNFTNHAVWKPLYNFKIKRAQEARHNQLFFQNVQNNEIFEIFKMFKNNSWINVYYTKSKRLISLSWNFVPRLIQVYRTPWGCLLFLFSTGNTFLGKFGPKNQNCQFELKFRTRLIWICRIM